MIIAHLPAGYLLTKALTACLPARIRTAGPWLAGLAASVAPDLDLVWFYVEGGIRTHRYYPTHWPLFWLALCLAVAVVLLAFKKRAWLVYPLVILANAWLHLALDCLVAPVFYLAPLAGDRLQLVRIPLVYDWWFWNYARHWIFQVELMIWSAAGLIFILSAWERRNVRPAD